MANELLYTSSNNSGTVFHRVTEDSETLEDVKAMIVDEDSDYQPTLALIVTWFDITLHDGESVS